MGTRKRKVAAGAVQEAVTAVGGPKWAAAYCDVSQEAVYQWLELGHIPRGRFAVLLARATLKHGRPVSVDRLVGLDDDEATPTGVTISPRTCSADRAAA